MINIIDSLKGYVTSELISKASELLEENSSGVQKTVNALIPTILSGLVNKAEEGAISSLFNTLSDERNPNFLDNLGDLIGGGNLAHNDPKNTAGDLMGSLFGNKTGDILDTVSSYAGVNRSSASTLLGMVGPLVVGHLAKKIKTNGWGVAALSSFLLGQKGNIMRALPSEMNSALGFASGERHTATTTTTSSGSGAKWLWWLLPLLGIVALLYFMRGCGDDTNAGVEITEQHLENTADNIKDIAEKTDDTISNAAHDTENAISETTDTETINSETTIPDTTIPEAANAVKESIGSFFSKKMACGTELNIPENGTEAQVLGFIEDDSKVVDITTWFNFDRLTFTTGSSHLDMSSSVEQLNNIKEIMKCYPEVKLKIGGYTDNTGSDEVNMKISQARADAVKTALVNMGIGADRLNTEGYGSQHPVASNDTEEGRAQNRRIAMRVMEK